MISRARTVMACTGRRARVVVSHVMAATMAVTSGMPIHSSQRIAPTESDTSASGLDTPTCS